MWCLSAMLTITRERFPLLTCYCCLGVCFLFVVVNRSVRIERGLPEEWIFHFPLSGGFSVLLFSLFFCFLFSIGGFFWSNALVLFTLCFSLSWLFVCRWWGFNFLFCLLGIINVCDSSSFAVWDPQCFYVPVWSHALEDRPPMHSSLFCGVHFYITSCLVDHPVSQK